MVEKIVKTVAKKFRTSGKVNSYGATPLDVVLNGEHPRFAESVDVAEVVKVVLEELLKERTKDEIHALIEKYGDPRYKTNEFALYDVISVAQQLHTTNLKLSTRCEVIAQMPCISELLGEAPDPDDEFGGCGCARCVARGAFDA